MRLAMQISTKTSFATIRRSAIVKRVATVVFQFVLLATAINCGVASGQNVDALSADRTDGLSEKLEFFENEIRPVLIESCMECHSSDTEASGGLSLDSKAAILAGGDSGNAINLDDASASRLIRAIEYSDPNLQMPPDEKLSARVVEAFKKWINDGAIDPRVASPTPSAKKQTGLPVSQAEEHWAYRSVSSTHNDSQTLTVDHFINSRLEEEQLPTAGPATELAQLRRIYFDLHGLPPAPEKIEAYLADTSPDKYQREVNMLLDSQHFGETFARHWMDVARYAESITLRGFVLHHAWRYRDYLIEAYYRDRPFNQMIQEQLAGDLLEHDDVSERSMQLTATAFLAMGNTNLERQDKDQLEMDFIDEQLEVMGRAFLAQTIGCARCHDHKFDPIPTSDYYALAGVMRSSVALEHDNVSKWIEQPLPLPPEQEAVFNGLKKRISSLKKDAARLKGRIHKSQLEQSKKVEVDELTGIVIDDVDAKFVGKWISSDFVARMVGTSYFYDDVNAPGFKTVTFEPKSLRPGNYELRLAYSASGNRATNTRVTVFSAGGETVVHVNQRKTPKLEKLWISLGKFQFEKDGQAFVMLTSEGADGIVIADAIQFLPQDEFQDDADQKRSADTPQGLTAEELAENAVLQAQIKKIESLLKKLENELADRPKYLTVIEKREPLDIPIHIRGDVHNLSDIVPRGFLTAVSPAWKETIPDSSSGRRELAQWISSPENPLTARVYVNRVWSWLNGQAIVSTVNNFGTTGTEPSHAELLDWLAEELVANNWSTKHIVRLIVNSDAYRRSSDFSSPQAMELDPNNLLYWRGSRRRLTVEALRDAMLKVSGELDHRVGGSGIRGKGNADYNYAHKGTRRSIYQPVFRNSLPDLYEAFDFADSSVSVGKRPRSTVATQALVLMNHPWVVARAKAAAERFNSLYNPKEKNTSELVESLYLHCFGREPTREELAASLAFLAESRVISDGEVNTSEESTIEPQLLEQLIHTLFASVDFRFLD